MLRFSYSRTTKPLPQFDAVVAHLLCSKWPGLENKKASNRRLFGLKSVSVYAVTQGLAGLELGNGGRWDLDLFTCLWVATGTGGAGGGFK